MIDIIVKKCQEAHVKIRPGDGPQAENEMPFLGGMSRASDPVCVRICVFEAPKFAPLRAILGDFPDTNYQELHGEYPARLVAPFMEEEQY